MNDVMKYVAMELAEGRLPDGTRYISKEALLARRAPQVAVGTDVNYGMGLFVDSQYGTPVVHLGRAIYGIPGVAVAARASDLADALRAAIADERPSLRERFLTKILRRDHIWCASQSPDRNGLNGLMQRVERMAKAV